MSEESPDPVETTRRAVAAVYRRDFDAIEGFYGEDAVLVAAELGRFEGRAAIRSLYEDMVEPYDDFRGDIDELIDLGNGVVFAIVTVVGHPVGSTGEVRFRYATVLVFADGVVIQQRNDIDIDAARATAERLAEERK